MRRLACFVTCLFSLFFIIPAYAQSYTITDCQGLQAMANDLTGNYTLANDIDCSDTVNWNGGQGFVPVGGVNSPFTGTFNGNGFTISALNLNYIPRS